MLKNMLFTLLLIVHFVGTVPAPLSMLINAECREEMMAQKFMNAYQDYYYTLLGPNNFDTDDGQLVSEEDVEMERNDALVKVINALYETPMETNVKTGLSNWIHVEYWTAVHMPDLLSLSAPTDDVVVFFENQIRMIYQMKHNAKKEALSVVDQRAGFLAMLLWHITGGLDVNVCGRMSLCPCQLMAACKHVKMYFYLTSIHDVSDTKPGQVQMISTLHEKRFTQEWTFKHAKRLSRLAFTAHHWPVLMLHHPDPVLIKEAIIGVNEVRTKLSECTNSEQMENINYDTPKGPLKAIIDALQLMSKLGCEYGEQLQSILSEQLLLLTNNEARDCKCEHAHCKTSILSKLNAQTNILPQPLIVLTNRFTQGNLRESLISHALLSMTSTLFLDALVHTVLYGKSERKESALLVFLHIVAHGSLFSSPLRSRLYLSETIRILIGALHKHSLMTAFSGHYIVTAEEPINDCRLEDYFMVGFAEVAAWQKCNGGGEEHVGQCFKYTFGQFAVLEGYDLIDDATRRVALKYYQSHGALETFDITSIM